MHEKVLKQRDRSEDGGIVIRDHGDSILLHEVPLDSPRAVTYVQYSQFCHIQCFSGS